MACEVKCILESLVPALVGKWRDTTANASTYEVSVDHDSKVTIRTTRHNGTVLVTRGLVRVDYNSGHIVWGRPPGRQYWLSELDSRSLKWEHQCLAAFVWHRVGEESQPTPKPSSPSKLKQEHRAQHQCEDDVDTAGMSPSQKGACAKAGWPGAITLTPNSTEAQSKQSHSQKGACNHEDNGCASGNVDTHGERGRFQKVGNVILVSAEEVKKRKLKIAPPHPDVVKKTRKLAPPPLIRSHVGGTEIAPPHLDVVKKTRKLAPPPLIRSHVGGNGDRPAAP